MKLIGKIGDDPIYLARKNGSEDPDLWFVSLANGSKPILLGSLKRFRPYEKVLLEV